MTGRVQKKYIKNPLTMLLMALCILLSFVYVAVAVSAVQNGYRLEVLESSLAEQAKERNQLKIELSNVSSLDHVLEQSNGLAYTEVQGVNYIQKPLASPVAAR